MTAIKVNNLSKKFKLYGSSGKRALEYLSMGRASGHTDFWALRDINFEVPEGTTVGIIGQNGSGKSTLLSILAGVLEPSGGSYEVNGKVSAILELGSGFHPEFTGRDNVYMYGSIMGLSKEEIDQKFDEILHFSELGDFIDQPLRTYSSGMIVRLAFSVAVNVNSNILIVDEALAVGDAIFQHRCFRKIREMQESGKTILYVGHDTEAVRSLCSYVMLLDGGRIIERGDSSTVVNKYHALIAERERIYNEGNLEEKGEIPSTGYETAYDFIEKLPFANKKALHSDWVRQETVEVRSLQRKVIFAVPPSEIDYDLLIGPGSSLVFAIGILPGARDKLKQEIKFDINIKCDGMVKNVFSRALDPKKNLYDKGWHNFKISLEEYYGKKVKIKFMTSQTGEDYSYSWSAWGWPRMIEYLEDAGLLDLNNRAINNSDELTVGESKTEVRYGNKKAEILKLELLDADGSPRLIFNSGELAVIKICIRLLEDIDSNLTVGCIIRNKFVAVYSINTKIYGLNFGKRRKGDTLVVKFKQNLKLGNGVYSLTNGVAIVHSDDEVEVLDRRSDWLFFKVVSNTVMHCVADLEAKIEECSE